MLHGQWRYEITPSVEDLYMSVWEMDKNAGLTAVALAHSSDPHNLMIDLIEDYIYFTQIYLADDLILLDKYVDDVDHRIDRIKRGDDLSPYYYYCQAEIYIHRSLVRSKRGQIIRAGWDINRAYKLLIKCKDKFPQFRYVDKSLGVIHTLMGSVQGFRRTFIRIFTSLDGSITQGMEEIESTHLWASDDSSIWTDETTIVHALMLGYINKNWEAALRIISAIDSDKMKTPLGCFLIATIADHGGQNDVVLQQMTHLSDDQFLSFDYLFILRGDALMQKGDIRAVDSYEKYLLQHKGQRYIKSIHQKIAWCLLLFYDDIDGYKDYMSRIPDIGTSLIGADQQAHYAAQSESIPHISLLRARLLYDGGYYQRSLEVLMSIEAHQLDDEEKLEYMYRLARLYHGLGDIDRARSYYLQVIRVGGDTKLYYACNSAIQVAHLYYMSGDDANALKYIDLALYMNPSERKTDLHQEARLLKQKVNQL